MAVQLLEMAQGEPNSRVSRAWFYSKISSLEVPKLPAQRHGSRDSWIVQYHTGRCCGMVKWYRRRGRISLPHPAAHEQPVEGANGTLHDMGARLRRTKSQL